MLTRSKKGIVKPKVPFAELLNESKIPTTVKEAIALPIWYKAMQLEFQALQNNKTWSLVPPTPSMHVVGSKWIFKVKYKSDGTIKRHKA